MSKEMIVLYEFSIRYHLSFGLNTLI